MFDKTILYISQFGDSSNNTYWSHSLRKCGCRVIDIRAVIEYEN